MSQFNQFNNIRNNISPNSICIHNHKELNVPEENSGIKILWMYPDTLNLFGGRGDLMALLHFSTLMGISCTIRRHNRLDEEIPFDWADCIYFSPGEVSSIDNIVQAIQKQKEELLEYINANKMIFAIGNTGAILAKEIRYLDGTTKDGLGLLDMEMIQAERPFGDDIWFEIEDSIEIIANQIQMFDVKMSDNQKAFGKVKYGKGNGNNQFEGARTKNVIFTHAIGPAMVRNPKFAEWLLLECAKVAGIDISLYSLTDDMIQFEQEAQNSIKEFFKQKI